MSFARLLVAAAALSASVNTSSSSSSEAHAIDGVTLRLVTTGLPDETGRLMGALDIRLASGWKTYWKEPGASGVPPQIDIGASINASTAVIHFPAPAWHEDKYGAWAGYGEPVVLPITFTVDAPDRFSVIEADVFLGICETMCIPVQARLTVEPASAPDDPDDAAFVEAAIRALPGEPRETFRIDDATLSGNVLRLKTIIPDSASGATALFLAPGGGFAFGAPKAVKAGPDGITFEAAVLSRPADGQPAAEISYTLTSGSAAVAGVFAVP
ncbi:hypothetical protein EJC49_03080 [Aquibium carbonis]|uniref:Thiol:disulfide interchange protein DsbD N-terminal domain-containing protein n=1 Tax=Aquibium carbonis TaxID=2495581 RepID=A0A429Z2G1_9HYPH|nr:protein-disulfide reductase DsbD domain-containing protein [Aquibium carbonis]RST87882.1 hypothetical protein EJC49_03080 [Aquibium carbonis]